MTRPVCHQPPAPDGHRYSPGPGPPVFFLRENQEWEMDRGQIHQQWLHGSCASTSQHILAQLMASPAPCSGHQAPRSGTVLAHVVCFCGHPQHRECQALGTGNVGHSAEGCAIPPVLQLLPHSALFPCRGRGTDSFPRQGKRFPVGIRLRGVGADPSASGVSVSAPHRGHRPHGGRYHSRSQATHWEGLQTP